MITKLKATNEIKKGHAKPMWKGERKCEQTEDAERVTELEQKERGFFFRKSGSSEGLRRQNERKRLDLRKRENVSGTAIVYRQNSPLWQWTSGLEAFLLLS